MFALPVGTSEVEGSSDDHPLILSGIKVNDFRCFLQVLYPVPVNQTITEERDIESALKLATMWSFNSVRDMLISKLSQLNLSPVRRLELARIFNISQWFVPALRELLSRKDGLTLKEAEMLGLALTHTLSCLRDIRYRLLISASKTVVRSVYAGRSRRERTLTAEVTVTGRDIELQSATLVEKAIDTELRKLAEDHGWVI